MAFIADTELTTEFTDTVYLYEAVNADTAEIGAVIKIGLEITAPTLETAATEALTAIFAFTVFPSDITDEIPDEIAIFALLVDAITNDDETAPVSDKVKVDVAAIFTDDASADETAIFALFADAITNADEIALVSGRVNVDVAATLTDDEIVDEISKVKVDVAATLTDDEIPAVNEIETFGEAVKFALASTLVCSCPAVFA